jgi:hypothetical protein
MEAYEIIELMCDLVHERVKHLSSQEECPPDLLGNDVLPYRKAILT